jgi:hypothetical protein
MPAPAAKLSTLELGDRKAKHAAKGWSGWRELTMTVVNFLGFLLDREQTIVLVADILTVTDHSLPST